MSHDITEDRFDTAISVEVLLTLLAGQGWLGVDHAFGYFEADLGSHSTGHAHLSNLLEVTAALHALGLFVVYARN